MAFISWAINFLSFREFYFAKVVIFKTGMAVQQVSANLVFEIRF